MPRVLELHEHQPEQAVALMGEELDTLRTRLSSLAVSPSAGQPGRYDLRPGSKVGSLDLASGLAPTSRLSCQIVVTDELDGLVVRLPARVTNLLSV